MYYSIDLDEHRTGGFFGFWSCKRCLAGIEFLILMMSDCVRLPTRLSREVEVKRQSSCCMQLTNKTDNYVAFKVISALSFLDFYLIFVVQIYAFVFMLLGL